MGTPSLVCELQAKVSPLMKCEASEGRISINRLMIKHKGKKRGCITVLVIVLVSPPRLPPRWRRSPPLYTSLWSLFRSLAPPPPHTSGGPWHLEEWAALGGVRERVRDRGSDIRDSQLWRASNLKTLPIKPRLNIKIQRRSSGNKEKLDRRWIYWYIFFVRSMVHFIYSRFLFPNENTSLSIQRLWLIDPVITSTSHWRRVKASR